MGVGANAEHSRAVACCLELHSVLRLCKSKLEMLRLLLDTADGTSWLIFWPSLLCLSLPPSGCRGSYFSPTSARASLSPVSSMEGMERWCHRLLKLASKLDPGRTNRYPNPIHYLILLPELYSHMSIFSTAIGLLWKGRMNWWGNWLFGFSLPLGWEDQTQSLV